jgi:hypothetical protein
MSTTPSFRVRSYRAAWKPSPEKEVRLRSGAALVAFVLAEPSIVLDHQHRVLREVLWSVTEIDGKYTTRFRSAGTLQLEEAGRIANWQSELRHDHVLTRNSLTEALLAGADPYDVLSTAVACTVTRAEHTRLSAFDRSHEGWARYAEAGVEVIDMATGELFLP